MEWLLSVFVVVALLVALFMLAHGGHADFVVSVHGGCVEFKGSFPSVHRAALKELLLDDLDLRSHISILGTRTGSRLKIRFRGAIDKRQQQRIRNLLSSRI